MLLNDTAEVINDVQGPPPWLAVLAEDATLQGAVLKAPVQGKQHILAILRAAIPLYDYQAFSYREQISPEFFMESYRASIQGVDVECAVWVHYNAAGQADALLINHHPLDAGLLFSQLMWRNVDEQYRHLYLSPEQFATLKA